MKLSWLAALGLLLPASACSTGPDTRSLNEIKPLLSSHQCGSHNNRAAMQRFSSQQELESFFQKRGHPQPFKTMTDSPVLLIEMGQKPNAGYRLQFDSATSSQEGQLTLTVNWLEPAPGMMQAQVITSPCLVLSLPNSGFQRIEIQDQAGNIKLSR